jgi:hypothetical protein
MMLFEEERIMGKRRSRRHQTEEKKEKSDAQADRCDCRICVKRQRG